MNQCSSCTALPALESSGYLLFTHTSFSVLRELRYHMLQNGYNSCIQDNTLYYYYSAVQTLSPFLDFIERALPEDLAGLKGAWTDKDQQAHANMINFPQLKERISRPSFMTVINNQQFTHHMQPIIQLNTGEVMGYEFLMRPQAEAAQFRPDQLFSFSQQSGLQSLLDNRARIASIKTSAKYLKPGIKRFINFLPSSIYDPDHCLLSTFATARSLGISTKDLVFEVVETEKFDNLEHLLRIFQIFQSHGVRVALDDLGAGYSTIDVMEELQPHYVKIDRSLVDYCDQELKKQQRLEKIISRAGSHGIITLAEGIERSEELNCVRELGFDLAQGYLIGEPKAALPFQADQNELVYCPGNKKDRS